MKEQNLDLNKEEFNDALRLRYDIPLEGLPSNCACGERFSINHALSCHKGGFIIMRHNNVRDFFTVMLDKVCVDVECEPHLLPVTNEVMRLRSAITDNEARLDIKAKGFWRRGQTVFYDVRITHVNSPTNAGKTTSSIFKEHEKAKKRAYLERVTEIEHGSFTPLVLGTNGGMGEECKKFISNLANKLAEKNGDTYANAITWIRVKLSVEILRATLICVRGSRTPFRVRQINADDFQLDNINSNII